MTFKMSVEPLDDDDAQETLPVDIIAEILLHLSPKSLLKHQLVCKEWQHTIFGHHFAEKYKNYTATEFYCQYIDDASNEPEPLSHSMPLTGAVDKVCDGYGLLLMLSGDDSKYCLWNPAIHKYLDLPSPHKGSDLFALSYLPAKRDYKILSLYKDEQSGDGFEIFTVGHSKEWRRLTSLSDVSRVSGVMDQTLLVSTGQEIHCFRDLVIGNKSWGEVITFDMANESCTVTPLPNPFLCWNWLLDWDGKLGFVGTIGENLCVMVLEDYRKQKWSEHQKIPLPFVRKGKCEVGSLFPLFCKNGKVLFWVKDGNKILSYSLETGLVQDLLILRDDAVLDGVCPYKPSLVSFVGMQLDTKLEPYRCAEGLTK